jgi:hypothetical protein
MKLLSDSPILRSIVLLRVLRALRGANYNPLCVNPCPSVVNCWLLIHELQGKVLCNGLEVLIEGQE